GRSHENFGVHVGIACQQQVENLAASGHIEWVIGAHFSGLVATDDAVQRGVTEHVPLLYVGAAFNQGFGDVPVGIDDRQYQRRDTVRIGLVEVGAFLDQHFHAAEAVFTHGEQQGRQAAAVEVLGTAFLGHVALVVTVDGGAVDVCALFNE